MKNRRAERPKRVTKGFFKYRSFKDLLWIFIVLFLASALFVIYHVDLSKSVNPVIKQVAFASLTFLLLSILITYYEYHAFNGSEGLIRRGPERMFVALTFDDGPSPDYTPMVLDVLKKHGVKATFFLVGKHVKKYPEVAKRIIEEGHEIGNHTYSHKDLVPSTKKKLEREILENQKVIEEVLGVKTSLFRPPRGIFSDAVLKFAGKHGLLTVLWSVSGIDWAQTPPFLIAKRIIQYAHPGAIILLHDSGALLRSEGHSRLNTVKALEIIIPALKEKGYSFATISELLSIQEKEEAEVATENFAVKF